MSEKEVRKTTTKKPVRKAAPKKAATKAVSTKKVVKKTPVRKTSTSVRKAPTPVAAEKANDKLVGRILIAGVLVFVCIVGFSIFLGVSGSGAIDIEARVANLKENASPEELNIIESIPVQKVKLRDGGLVPSVAPEEVVAPAPTVVATSTDKSATSTDEVATSTEAVVDEQSEESSIENTDTGSSTEGFPIEESL